MDRRRITRLFAASTLAAWTYPLLAQQPGYPNRAIRFISPFAAGSSSDTSARFIANHLGVALNQPVVVENMPGADARIGVMAVKNAPADGYTVLVGSWTSLAVNPILIKDLPYDGLKDFKPVAGVGRSMLGISVSGKSEIKSLQQLIEIAKRTPKALNFGNFGTGYRLAIEWFSEIAGIQFTFVPYRVTSQMNLDLAGGQIDVAMDGVTSMTKLAKSGQLRLLAVTGEHRHPEFPDVPTVKESFPEYAIYGWTALMVRAEVPDEFTQKLADNVQKILASKEGRDFAAKVGSELLNLGPAEMRKYQVDQITRLTRVAEAAGLKGQ